MRVVAATIAALIVAIAVPGAVAAQARDAAKPQEDRHEAMRALRDRPFGSMGTGSIMSATGFDSAFGTGGSIASGVGRGTGVEAGGPDSSALPAGRRSPTSPGPLGVPDR